MAREPVDLMFRARGNVGPAFPANSFAAAFAGIHPLGVGGFVLALVAGTALATLSFGWLFAEEEAPS